MRPNRAAREGRPIRAPGGRLGNSGDTPPEYALWAQLFKALAHPVRLYIAEEVRASPRNVGQLARLVRLDASTVCRHLWLLKNAGLIRSQKRGTYVYYSVASPLSHTMLECIRKARCARPPGR